MQSEKIFIEAINSNRGILTKVCNLYLKDPQERNDLLQEMLLNAWRGMRSFKGEAKFSTWLYRVALNTAITYYKKSNAAKTRFIFPDTIPEIVATVPEEENLVAMYKAIEDLPPVDKAIVMLFLDDFSYMEIADMIGITANHVAVKMSRIKLKLREDAKKHL